MSQGIAADARHQVAGALPAATHEASCGSGPRLSRDPQAQFRVSGRSGHPGCLGSQDQPHELLKTSGLKCMHFGGTCGSVPLTVAASFHCLPPQYAGHWEELRCSNPESAELANQHRLPRSMLGSSSSREYC